MSVSLNSINEQMQHVNYYFKLMQNKEVLIIHFNLVKFFYLQTKFLIYNFNKNRIKL